MKFIILWASVEFLSSLAIGCAGIQVTRIGTVQAPGNGIQAFYNKKPAAWPTFDVDEITKLFE
jgi:hypothetical protein